MHNIKTEEWEFVLNAKDPQYEEKFDSLFKKYYENSLEEGLGELEQQMLKEYTTKPYWVLSLPALPNQTKNNAERRRIQIFIVLVNTVGIIDDWEKTFGKRKSVNMMKNLYVNLVLLQNRRYAAEVLGKELISVDKNKEYSRIIKIIFLIIMLVFIWAFFLLVPMT